MSMLAKVFTNPFDGGEDLGEQPGPPLPPETLGFRAIEHQAAEPDYPPSTCCVRVVRLGCNSSDLNSQIIRGQGRASLRSADQWLGLRWRRRTGGKR
jgi:hypothetical protein